jgi:hypothetical protein
MRIGIYTKQIGNHLDNLVLNKIGTSVYEHLIKKK